MTIEKAQKINVLYNRATTLSRDISVLLDDRCEIESVRFDRHFMIESNPFLSLNNEQKERIRVYILNMLKAELLEVENELNLEK